MNGFLTNIVRRSQHNIQLAQPAQTPPYSSTLHHAHDYDLDSNNLDIGMESEVEQASLSQPDVASTLSLPAHAETAHQATSRAHTTSEAKPEAQTFNRTASPAVIARPPAETPSTVATKSGDSTAAITPSAPVLQRRVTPQAQHSPAQTVNQSYSDNVDAVLPNTRRTHEQLQAPSIGEQADSADVNPRGLRDAKTVGDASLTKQTVTETPHEESLESTNSPLATHARKALEGNQASAAIESNPTVEVDSKLASVTQEGRQAEVYAATLTAAAELSRPNSLTKQTAKLGSELETRPRQDQSPVFSQTPERHLIDNEPSQRASPLPPTQIIEISIGRLEVQVVQPEIPTTKPSQPNPHNISLSKYLSEGRRR